MGKRLEDSIRRQAEKEMMALPRLQAQARAEVNASLSQLTGNVLTFVSGDDERRLLRFQIWSEKYKVSVGYILRVLFDYYQTRVTSKRKPKSGFRLPVRIATLTGKASEWILQQQLEKDFPNGENRSIWMQRQREVLMQWRDLRRNGADEFTTRRKNLMDFEWPGRYVKYYSRRIEELRRAKERERQHSRRTQKPYRDNPWV